MCKEIRDVIRGMLTVAVAALLFLGAPAQQAFAAGTAGNVVIRGTVYIADTGEAMVGAKVYAVHLDTKQVFSSAPASGKGEYQITGLPYGYYDLAVETVDGLFLANRVVNAPAGEKVTLSLALGPPQPEDTEWWSAEPDRRIPGLDRIPDGVARIVEGIPRLGRQAIEAATGVAASTGAAASGAGAAGAAGTMAAWVVPALVGGGLIILATTLDDDGADQEDPGASPF